MLARPLAANSVWWALTRRSTLDPEVKAILVQCGRAVTVFKRGTRASAPQGRWRPDVLRPPTHRDVWSRSGFFLPPPRTTAVYTSYFVAGVRLF